MKPPLERFLVCAGAAVLLSAAGCGETVAPRPLPSVSLEPEAVTLQVTQSVQVEVVADSAVRRQVVLVSSDPEIATIQPPVTVMGAKPGRAVIRALVDHRPTPDSVVVHVIPRDSLCMDCGGWPQAVLAITDTAGRLLDPRALHGLIELRVTVDLPAPLQALGLEFRVDGTTICSQTATSGQALHVCRLDTEEVVAGARRFALGAHVLSAVLRQPAGQILAVSSQEVVFQAPAPATTVTRGRARSPINVRPGE